jgi:thymidine kinase
MSLLLSVAEQVDKLFAICVRCGAYATRSQRLIDGQPAPYDAPTIVVGGLDMYEARCRKCFEAPQPSIAGQDETQVGADVL